MWLNRIHLAAVLHGCLLLLACNGPLSNPSPNTDTNTDTDTDTNTDPPPPPITNESWKLDWSDEFNGSALDTSVWNYDVGAGGWGNSESQYYQKQNAVVQDGFLTITAKVEAVGDAPYSSARIQTAKKKSFTYGRFEIRAKLPETQGMWPAFWLLGTNCNSFNLYGGDVTWPGCGEIDVMEMVGGLSDGTGDYTCHGTLHYLDSTGKNPAPRSTWKNSGKLSAGFHTYAVDWTPQGFTFLIDGIPYGTTLISSDMEEFHKPFFLLLNLAIGGPWGGWTNSTTVFPQTFVIDYVRHYTRTWPELGTVTGLPSNWHLTKEPKMESKAGTTSGAEPIVKLAASSLSWNTPYLTGTYDAGAWSLVIWTMSITGSSQVQARIYKKGLGSEVLIGETTADPSTTGSGNHATKFSFPGISAITLTKETLRIELTKLSGTELSLIVNGNDFDSRLILPLSTTGTVSDSFPPTTPFPNP